MTFSFVFIKVRVVFSEICFIPRKLSGPAAASSHCMAVYTLSHKLLLKRSFKSDMKVHSLSYSRSQKLKTISQGPNSDKTHSYDSEGHMLHGKKEGSMYFGEMVGTQWEVYLG